MNQTPCPSPFVRTKWLTSLFLHFRCSERRTEKSRKLRKTGKATDRQILPRGLYPWNVMCDCLMRARNLCMTSPDEGGADEHRETDPLLTEESSLGYRAGEQIRVPVWTDGHRSLIIITADPESESNTAHNTVLLGSPMMAAPIHLYSWTIEKQNAICTLQGSTLHHQLLSHRMSANHRTQLLLSRTTQFISH